MTRQRWPLYLWSLHLTLPLLVVSYAIWRLLAGPTLGWQIQIAAAFAACWFSSGLALSLLPSGRRWLLENRLKWLVALTAGLITWTVLDVAITAIGLVPTIAEIRAISLLYKPAVSTVHRLLANQTVNFLNNPEYRINSRGFRGPEIILPKPEGTTRLVFLGGSHVFDLFGDNWPINVGKILSTPDHPVDVINAGVPGHRTTDSLGKFVTELWLLEPDVVVLSQAWNDIKYFSQLTPRRPYRDVVKPPQHDWRTQPKGIDRLLCVSSTYRTGRISLIKTVVGAEGEVPRALTGRVNEWGLKQYRMNIELLCEAAKNVGARVVLCKQARLPTAESDDAVRQKINYHYVGLEHDELLMAFAECDRIVEDIAKEQQCLLIDMSGDISGNTKKPWNIYFLKSHR